MSPVSGTLCDALMAPMPGELTFSINRRLVASGLSVDESAVRQAVGFAFRTLKLVVEPGGAVGLAALLSGRFSARGKTVAVILSGGNLDPALFSEILVSAPE